jgi:hypothetical protein
MSVKTLAFRVALVNRVLREIKERNASIISGSMYVDSWGADDGTSVDQSRLYLTISNGDDATIGVLKREIPKYLPVCLVKQETSSASSSSWVTFVKVDDQNPRWSVLPLVRLLSRENRHTATTAASGAHTNTLDDRNGEEEYDTYGQARVAKEILESAGNDRILDKVMSSERINGRNKLTKDGIVFAYDSFVDSPLAVMGIVVSVAFMVYTMIYLVAFHWRGYSGVFTSFNDFGYDAYLVNAVRDRWWIVAEHALMCVFPNNQ